MRSNCRIGAVYVLCCLSHFDKWVSLVFCSPVYSVSACTYRTMLLLPGALCFYLFCYEISSVPVTGKGPT